MTYHLEVDDEWKHVHLKDLWAYNKLYLSSALGYKCGPIGTNVPKPDYYMVRPCMNFMGMGRYARIEWVSLSTERFHPSEFWCEVFHGDHYSVDFYKKESKLVVFGERDIYDPPYKWRRWTKIDEKIEFPEILNDLDGDYDWINCEFIGNKLIEVHFRQNPDFRYGNSVAIPVWSDETPQKLEDYIFVDDPDYLRKGFYINKG